MVHEHQAYTLYTDTNVDTLENRITYTYVIFRERDYMHHPIVHMRFKWRKLEISCYTFRTGTRSTFSFFPNSFPDFMICSTERMPISERFGSRV